MHNVVAALLATQLLKTTSSIRTVQMLMQLCVQCRRGRLYGCTLCSTHMRVNTHTQTHTQLALDTDVCALCVQCRRGRLDGCTLCSTHVRVNTHTHTQTQLALDTDACAIVCAMQAWAIGWLRLVRLQCCSAWPLRKRRWLRPAWSRSSGRCACTMYFIESVSQQWHLRMHHVC